jgi:hypothetical protein
MLVRLLGRNQDEVQQTIHCSIEAIQLAIMPSNASGGHFAVCNLPSHFDQSKALSETI